MKKIHFLCKDKIIGTQNELKRVEWVIKTLRNIPDKTRILDAGAGEKRYMPYCSHLDYVSQDFAQYDGVGNKQGLQMGTWDQNNLDIVCDIASIPEPDTSFGAILCTEVIEHLPDPIMALKEFSRLLVKDGYLILTAPFSSITHFAPIYYSTGFSRYYYEHHLNNHGFKIISLEANGNYYEYLAQEIRRLPQIVELYSSSSLGWIDRVAIRLMLQSLKIFNLYDKGSNELSCYGYHILAQKK